LNLTDKQISDVKILPLKIKNKKKKVENILDILPLNKQDIKMQD